MWFDYIGQTGRSVCERFREHKYSVNKKSSTNVGKHFYDTGHNLSNLKIVPSEQIRSSNPCIRISREKYYIRKFNPSLNKRI